MPVPIEANPLFSPFFRYASHLRQISGGSLCSWAKWRDPMMRCNTTARL